MAARGPRIASPGLQERMGNLKRLCAERASTGRLERGFRLVIWVVLAVPTFLASGEPGGELLAPIVIRVPGVRCGMASRIASRAGKPAPTAPLSRSRPSRSFWSSRPFPAPKARLRPFYELGGPHCSSAICFGR